MQFVQVVDEEGAESVVTLGACHVLGWDIPDNVASYPVLFAPTTMMNGTNLFKMQSTSDHGVAETAYDAIHCKISAVTQGYFHDPFAKLFEKKATRRIPLIHRGYYLRHVAVEHAVSLFLDGRGGDASASPVQIVSLGAGLDTLFFRLTQQEHAPQFNLRMFEVDCDAITAQKVALLQTHAPTCFGATTPVVVSNPTTFAATLPALESSYTALACDLGNVTVLQDTLAAHGLDPQVPTLVLAECVLAYLAPAASSALLHWASHAFADSFLVSYDPIGLEQSAFGAQLHKYFEAKGCTLRSAASLFGSIETTASVLQELGWRSVRVCNLNVLFDALTDAAEHERLARLEPFDEFEDWSLTNHHYGFVVATNRCGESSVGAHAVDAWPATSLPGTLQAYRLGSGNILTIRPCRATDAAAVRRLFETSHLEYASKSVRKLVAKCLHTDLADISESYMARQTTSGFWVAAVDGRIVGCVALKPFRGAVAELCRLGVDREMRRSRIAARLVDALERHAVACGYTSIVLETLGEMDAAKSFYAACGYLHVDSTHVGKPPAAFVLERRRRVEQRLSAAFLVCSMTTRWVKFWRPPTGLGEPSAPYRGRRDVGWVVVAFGHDDVHVRMMGMCVVVLLLQVVAVGLRVRPFPRRLVPSATLVCVSSAHLPLLPVDVRRVVVSVHLVAPLGWILKRRPGLRLSKPVLQPQHIDLFQTDQSERWIPRSTNQITDAAFGAPAGDDVCEATSTVAEARPPVASAQAGAFGTMDAICEPCVDPSRTASAAAASAAFSVVSLRFHGLLG
ncbi:Aste57867_2622 [Aphanomyces stellatus]|uniref:[phosphatase 2A protein]-leucine-carboxy methyltransferase n=1 Tax=Aphanomyces stellatus TaxID=120398 RepID=A0A485K9L4_9STRA|nr:hypothetical protein As57867_002615 [Aphanomyces stellatus]VFT79818.1 Aste57867_2622 [Aphanomyces stellatus]